MRVLARRASITGIQVFTQQHGGHGKPQPGGDDEVHEGVDDDGGEHEAEQAEGGQAAHHDHRLGHPHAHPGHQAAGGQRGYFLTR